MGSTRNFGLDLVDAESGARYAGLDVDNHICRADKPFHMTVEKAWHSLSAIERIHIGIENVVIIKVSRIITSDVYVLLTRFK